MKIPTIAAIASPPGSGGIGIVKISGPDAVGIAERTFRHCINGGRAVIRDGVQHSQTVPFRSHRLYYGHIIDPDNCEILDEVLLFVMRAPRSYTREDVVEIQAHSGPAVMRSILALILRQGAQMAEAGEFTRRAFLNGRIDLTQAEAVIDLINAKTDAAFKAATCQVSGGLRDAVESTRGDLSDLLAHIEAGIDFPEDVDTNDHNALNGPLKEIAGSLEKLIRGHREAHIYRDGINIAIVGKPNVGKSSLLNRLVEKDRAIVNALPGTTRDPVDGIFQLHGVPVNITDTAGIHTTDDPVEKIGISKSKTCIDDARMVLLVLDAAEGVGSSDEQVYDLCCEKPLIYVVNKTDLVHTVRYDNRWLPSGWKKGTVVPVSALYGQGIDQLKEKIYSAVVDYPLDPGTHAVIPNLRHNHALEKCYQNVKNVTRSLDEGRPLELGAIDLHEALNCLDDILGTRAELDILDRIFNRFCIGK